MVIKNSFSKAIKAGKRIYYLDVKKTGKMKCSWLSQKVRKLYRVEGDDSQVSFEKHKIFLYKRF